MAFIVDVAFFLPLSAITDGGGFLLYLQVITEDDGFCLDLVFLAFSGQARSDINLAFIHAGSGSGHRRRTDQIRSSTIGHQLGFPGCGSCELAADLGAPAQIRSVEAGGGLGAAGGPAALFFSDGPLPRSMEEAW
jgi:hypothetical protein